MRRREFIGMAGSAAAWPLMANAQQDDRLRRVGVIISGAESDPIYQARLANLREGLQQLGWIEDRNLRLDVRFNAADLVRARGNARELVGLAPDVVVTQGTASTRALQELTRTIPIVFVSVGDPAVTGVVGSIARPGGNTTGITNLFPSIAGKWVELLREAAPHVTRAALIFNSDPAPANPYLAAIEAAATALAVKAIRTPVRNATEIERAINGFATEPNGGLINIPPSFVDADRGLILRLVRQHRLPTISYNRSYAAEGDLISYGPDPAELHRSAASYVDRILRGAKPGDLPVHFPSKFDLVINLKAAKALGLTIPRTLIARADELIE